MTDRHRLDRCDAVAPASGDACCVARTCRLSSGGVQSWLCVPDVCNQLLGPSGLRLDEWQADGSVRIVKTGPHRTVYHVAACGGLYVKQYRVSGWLGALQHLIRPARAQLEWEAARRVAQADVPTFEPLAVGVTRRGFRMTESWLATREIESVVPVDEFTESLRHRADREACHARRQLAEGLGALVGRMHRAGLLHRDLHAGNVLARLEPDGFLALWLIDLHAVSPRRVLSARDVEWNLGQLNNFFVGRATPADRVRFLHAYRAELEQHGESSAPAVSRAMLDVPLRDLAQRLDASCARAILETYRNGDAKWRRGNRRLIIADTPRARCRGVAALGREWLERFRDDPETVLSTESVPTTRDVSIQRFSGRMPRPRRLLVRSRPGPAERAWEMGHALLRRGLPAVRPLAFVESAEPGGAALLLLERPANSLPLRQFLTDHVASQSRSSALLPHLAENVARVLRRFHDLGFTHANLGIDSLRVVPDTGQPAGWAFAIDSLKCVEQRRVRAGGRIEQLARLARSVGPFASPLVCRQFLNAYLGRRDRDQRAVFWRRIADRAPLRTSAIEPDHSNLRNAA